MALLQSRPRLVRRPEPKTASHRRIPVVGITGSSGKTTTKDMVAAILAERGPVLKTKYNLNAPGDVRRMARNLRPSHWAAVYEIASFKPGYVAASCRIVHPKIGIVTNIGLAHAGLLGGIKGVARDKGALIRSLPSSGVAIINDDDPGCRLLDFGRFKGRVVRYGLTPKSQVWAAHIRYEGAGMRFVAHRGEEAVELYIPALGEHMVSNALAAFIAARELGLSAEAIQRGLRKFSVARGRMQVFRTDDGILLLNDSFNANPHSMAAGIRVLRQAGKGRRIAVVGAMAELGRWAKNAHIELGHKLVGGIDEVVLVGKMAQTVAAGIEAARRNGGAGDGTRGGPNGGGTKGDGPHVTIVGSPEAAVRHLKATLKAPAVVWFKGSHSAHIGRAFGQLGEALGVKLPRLHAAGATGKPRPHALATRRVRLKRRLGRV